MSDFAPSASELFKALKGRGRPHDFKCCCPAHRDRTPSLQVTEKNGHVLLHCHAGCSQEAVIGALRDARLWPEPKKGGHRPSYSNGNRRDPEAKIVTPDELKVPPILPAPTLDDERVRHYRRGVMATPNVLREHIYCQGGVPVFIKQRLKEGSQKFVPHWRVEDGDAELWQNIAPVGFKKLPYVAPGGDPFRVEGSRARSLFWCEGEKDVDTVAKLGLDAFTFGSAGHIPTGAALYLKGRKVVIPVDNDDAGRRDAEAKARCCQGLATSIKVISFPELSEKGDISDWLLSHSCDELRALIGSVPEWKLAASSGGGTAGDTWPEPKPLLVRARLSGAHRAEGVGAMSQDSPSGHSRPGRSNNGWDSPGRGKAARGYHQNRQQSVPSRKGENNERRPATSPSDRDLDEMNAQYAVVKIGGKTRVVSLEESPAYPGSKVPIFSTINDFCAFHAKRKKEVEAPDGTLKRVGIGRWWIDHEQRRQYDAIVYAPNVTEPGKLNLWTGFGCEPKPGDCGLYLTHLHEIVCGGSTEYSEYLLGWMANTAQYPGRQGEVAVILRGREGVGKGVFAKEFGRLFGTHFKHVVNAKHLVGNFNAHLQHCSVLFADEAFFAGDRSHESVLKGLITEETLLIEPKGVDSYSVRNCLHLIMSSNSEWVVPAGADARRYFVLDVSPAHMQDSKYFAAIARQMDNGGRAALLHYLLGLDLSGFDVRAVPQTAALADQKTRSRRGVDRLVEMIAYSGTVPAADITHPNVAVTTGEDKGEGFYCGARHMVPELRHDSSIVVAKTLKDDWGCRSWKSGYRRGIEFPPLEELRAIFDRKHGVQDWPADVVDWEGP